MVNLQLEGELNINSTEDALKDALIDDSLNEQLTELSIKDLNYGKNSS